MKCEHAKGLMADAWVDKAWVDKTRVEGLDPALKAHLSSCGECAAEMAQLSALWDRMGDIPAPEPSSALTARWESTLDMAISAGKRPAWFSLASLWPQRPAWQMGIAAACLVLGLAVGSSFRTNRGEITQLTKEVASTRQMVALSLLQQQSATERLRGVDYTVSMRAMEPDVVSALVQAVNHDPNVNVRLAAIDALMKVSGDAHVRQSLASSLPMQDSPIVQAALVDYVADAHDKDAVGTLKQFSSRQDLNPLVRQRVDAAVQRLTEYR